MIISQCNLFKDQNNDKFLENLSSLKVSDNLYQILFLYRFVYIIILYFNIYNKEFIRTYILYNYFFNFVLKIYTHI